ncbi:hypothetical protein HMPREF3033_01384 [Veillonellaceae bacterium DNF00751]|uniref:Uncharacterized protein n=1 Tax=Megasphaera lornae TaxID=1000568 RepID=A0ABP2L4H0_9FIRM|nr:hypothetical protein HMPREF1039_1099 [Megasphaera lornae]KXB91023.1 hypothetical protein HMPREF3033_01384 [Veillonellaceae bacterium DNF00751]
MRLHYSMNINSSQHKEFFEILSKKYRKMVLFKKVRMINK